MNQALAVMHGSAVRAAVAVCAMVLMAGPGIVAAQDKILNFVNSLGRTLDPHVAQALAGSFIQLNAYDNLYRYQGNPPKMEPWLARSHTVSADGLTWEISLRENVKFHDGSDLTAEDVVYSFRRALALKQAVASVFQLVLKPENVTAPARFKVSFVLNKPYAPFFSALPLISVVNPRLIKQHEEKGDWGKKWLATNEAGSGAYKIVPGSFVSQSALELAYFPDHFKGWQPNSAKRVKVTYTEEKTTQVMALMKGSADSSDPRLPPDTTERLEKSGKVTVHRDSTMRLFLFTMNNQKPPLNNVHVRRAISYAFNYGGFIGQIMHNVPKRNPVPLPLGMWGYPQDVKGYSYDLAKAKAELELAKKDGVDLSRELSFMAITAADETVQAGQLLQSDLRKLGIKLKIGSAPFYNLVGLTKTKEATPDIWAHWVSTYFVDPENWVGQMYHSSYHGTWKGSAWYRNPEVETLLESARTITDQSRRDVLYKNAIRKIVDDAAAVWIYDAVQLRATSNRITGYRFSPVGSGGELQSIVFK